MSKSLSLNKWFSRNMLFAGNTMQGQRGEGGHLGKVAEKMKIFENEVLILEEYDEKLEETLGGGNRNR